MALNAHNSGLRVRELPGQRCVRHSQGSWGGRKLYPSEISRRRREEEPVGNKREKQKEWREEREWCAGGSAGIAMIFESVGLEYLRNQVHDTLLSFSLFSPFFLSFSFFLFFHLQLSLHIHHIPSVASLLHLSFFPSSPSSLKGSS